MFVQTKKGSEATKIGSTFESLYFGSKDKSKKIFSNKVIRD